jgi:hypothetical protein
MRRFKVGKRVVGPDGEGTVIAHVSKHDIHIQFDNGSSGLFCQDKRCSEYEAIYPLPKERVRVNNE